MPRLLSICLVLVTFPLRAQAPVVPLPTAPQILTSGIAEVELRPDRATLVFTVETRGATAAIAGAATARKQRAVIDSLRVMGVAADQMTTASIEIHPEYFSPGENKPPRVSGYLARNSLRVEVRNIDQTGALIDAALMKEATGIGSLLFSSSVAEDARRQALGLAVAKAKSEAEAIAHAAGGTLGGMIELSALPNDLRPLELGGVLRMRSQIEATPVEAGQIRVAATVSARWGYIARH